MSRFFKSFVVSLISSVLLYYSAAWAVLKCFHEEDHSGYSAVVSVTDAHGGDTYPLFSRHAHANLDCLDFDYHTESLGGPLASTLLDKAAVRAVSQVRNDFTLRALAGERARWLWLNAVFDRFPSTTFLIDLPRYLSLSNLRI